MTIIYTFNLVIELLFIKDGNLAYSYKSIRNYYIR